MPTKRQQQYHLESHHFILIFWLLTALLYGGKRLITSWFAPDAPPSELAQAEAELADTTPEVEEKESEDTYNTEEDELSAYNHHAPEAIAIPDSIKEARRVVDDLFLCPRRPVAFLDHNGKPIRNKVRSIDAATEFNDLNDVQLATASTIGAPECDTRDDVHSMNHRYVYIGASPYYDIEELTYSVPYLVPRAAILLDEIGHAFLDSLTAKGIPFHKLVVTSVLRTNEDVAKLTRFNANASENSCHRFGTTFDIAYTTYYRVSDPDGEKQVEWGAGDLMPILCEVLADQRRLGTCYIKHETRKRCFHITCR